MAILGNHSSHVPCNVQHIEVTYTVGASYYEIHTLWLYTPSCHSDKWDTSTWVGVL